MIKIPKRITSLITALSIVAASLVFFPVTARAEWTGSGTEGDPYIIYSAQDLIYIGEAAATEREKHFALYDDIDLSAYSNWYTVANKTMRCDFKGVFDGRGHKITGLKAVVPVSVEVGRLQGTYVGGLFYSLTDGTIKNLTIEGNISETLVGTDVTATVIIGGFVCKVAASSANATPTITNCHFVGDITVSTKNTAYDRADATIGGIAATASGSVGNQTITFEKCSVKGVLTVSALSGNYSSSIFGAAIGGIVGTVGTSTIGYYRFPGKAVIRECFADITVSGQSPATVYHDGSTYTSHGADYIGGIVGCFGQDGKNEDNKRGLIENCYSKIQTGETISFRGIGGIAGYAGGVDIVSCYSIGEIENKMGTTIAYSPINAPITGGIVALTNYSGTNLADVKISNCASLLSALKQPSNLSASIHRVMGAAISTGNTLENNVAYEGMLNPEGTDTWTVKLANQPNGADITADEIVEDGTLGGRFSTPWHTEDGKLPWLFEPMAIPAYINPPTPPTISTASLANGAVGAVYSVTLAASGDTPMTWSVSSGSLPTGLSLNSSTGVISGTPTAANSYNLTIKAENEGGVDTKALTITINKGTGAAVSGAPAAATITENGITVNAVTNAGSTSQTVEYAISASSQTPQDGWQSGTTFSGLSAGTAYYVFARTKENTNYYAGTADSRAISTLAEGLTDDDIVAADKLLITWDAIRNANILQSDVKTNLVTLPTNGVNGSAISWASTNTTAVSTTGAVTRPAYTATDATLTLTATLTKGAATDTVTFALTVPKLSQTDAEAVAADKALIDLGFYPQCQYFTNGRQNKPCDAPNKRG